MDSTRNNSAAAVYSDSATRKAIRHNFINVKTKGAGAIVGFAVHSDALIIFKTDSPGVFVRRTTISARGVTSHRSTQRSIVEGQARCSFRLRPNVLLSRGDTVSPIGLDVETTRRLSRPAAELYCRRVLQERLLSLLPESNTYNKRQGASV